MGAYDVDAFPWLVEEKAWLRGLVQRQVPVLGICLGSQLLADALGGRAFQGGRPEAGLVPLELTPEGRTHPVIRACGDRVFSLHQDTFELPEGATLLARNANYPQAFEFGSALAVQFHPDADADLALEWAKEIPPFLDRAGVELGDYQAELEAAEPTLDRQSRRLFAAFLEAV